MQEQDSSHFPCPILAGLYHIHFLNNKDFFASYANMNIWMA